MIKTLIFCFLFICTTVACTANKSPTLQQAINQYYGSDIEGALDNFMALSKQNNAEAYYYLGLIYSDSRFKQFNPKTAISYLLSAADLNHIEAMNKLGLIYDNGVGVEQNSLISLDWYRKAKQAEKPITQNIIFSKNENNKLVNSEYPTIFLDLLKEAEDGNAELQHKVAINYDNGALIPRDFSKALFWYKKAALNNYKESQFMLGYFYCRGLGIPQDSNLANDWLIKSGRRAICP